MANENDVVRLKHLNSLASVVHDITLHSGGASLPDNADFALYVPNDTSIIITGKQAPVLSLGSWSSADTVYSAAITYTGDGTLSTDIGTISNDILTVADEDGTFNGAISAAGGDSYANISLAFNHSKEIVEGSGDLFDPKLTITNSEPSEYTVNWLGNGRAFLRYSFGSLPTEIFKNTPFTLKYAGGIFLNSDGVYAQAWKIT